MTVSQLIESLKNYHPNLPVIVSVYEGGYNDVDHIKNVKIVRNYHDVLYFGKHESVDGLYNGTSEILKKSAVDALCIG